MRKIILFHLFQLFFLSKADSITKVRLSPDALDRLFCPFVSRALNSRLRTTSVFAWNAVVDETVSKIKIGVPPADTHCRYALVPSDNAVRLLLDWSLVGSSDFQLEATLDLAWRDGAVRADCNASVAGGQKAKTTFDEKTMKESICKELTGYFVQTPTTVVYPIWADLNLMYSLNSVTVTDKDVEFELLTQLEPRNLMFALRPISLSPSQTGKTLQVAFDQNVIGAIFDTLYQKYQDHGFKLTSETTPSLSPDCGSGTPAADAKACLGSFLKSISAAESPDGVIDCEFKFDAAPQIKIGNDGTIVSASGSVRISRNENITNTTDHIFGPNVTLAKFDFRLVSRLNASVTLDKKVKASTSINDIALMMSEFEVPNLPPSHESFNSTTQQLVRSLAPILIGQINDWLGVGLPLPLPQSVKLVGPKVMTVDSGFEVVADVGSL